MKKLISIVATLMVVQPAFAGFVELSCESLNFGKEVLDVTLVVTDDNQSKATIRLEQHTSYVLCEVTPQQDFKEIKCVADGFELNLVAIVDSERVEGKGTIRGAKVDELRKTRPGIDYVVCPVR